MRKDKIREELNKLNETSNMSDIQNYIKCMLKENNYNNTPLELLCYLTEEVGELAKEIRKHESNMEMDINKKYSSNIKDELADVFIYVLTIADKYNIDLLDALKRKETINLERTWE